jgi:hypothetical protein
MHVGDRNFRNATHGSRTHALSDLSQYGCGETWKNIGWKTTIVLSKSGLCSANVAHNLCLQGTIMRSQQQIIDMAMNGSGIRDIARVLHISPTTVLDTLKKRACNPSRQ